MYTQRHTHTHGIKLPREISAYDMREATVNAEWDRHAPVVGINGLLTITTGSLKSRHTACANPLQTLDSQAACGLACASEGGVA